MRNGDFRNAAAVGSGSFVNTVPNVGGGVIPANLIDPGGQVLLNVFPQPNANPAITGGYNYVDNILIDQNGWQGLARLDFNISDNTKLFVRYNIQRETQPFVIGFWWRNGERNLPYPSPIEGKNRSDSVTASLTHVFNPTLTNETIFGLTYIDFPNEYTNRAAISRQALGYPYEGVFGENSDQIPSVDAGGWGANGPIYYNPGGFDPILFATKWQISAQDNLTKVWGLHTVKAGAYYEYVSNAQPNSANSNGSSSRTTGGHTLGQHVRRPPDGQPRQLQRVVDEQVNDMHYNLLEGYLQDSWKLKPRLTLDLGLRCRRTWGPGRTTNGLGMAAWDQSKYASELAAGTHYPGIAYTAKDPSAPLSGVDGSWFYVTPRVGFAYDVKGTGETVVRGGIGMYRYHEPQSIYSGLLGLGEGQRSYSADNVTLSGVEGLGSGALPGAGSAIQFDDDKQPLGYTWSLHLNQKLPYSMNVELGYVGSKNE